MIVELKKTKITKSIIDQSLLGNNEMYYKWDLDDLLGWCIIKSGKHWLRYSLIHDKNKGQVFKLRYIQQGRHIELIKESVQRGSNREGYTFPEVYKIKIYWIDWSRTQEILEQTNQSDEEIKTIHRSIERFTNVINEKGQIYL